MSKIRVHELAKKLDKESKEIISILKDKNIEVKNHMSTLTDEAVELVEKMFSVKEKENSTASKTEEKAENKSDNVKKNSNITQVYNPQNSRASKPAQNRNRTNNTGRQNNNQNNNQSNNKSGDAKPAQNNRDNNRGTNRAVNNKNTSAANTGSNNNNRNNTNNSNAAANTRNNTNNNSTAANTRNNTNNGNTSANGTGNNTNSSNNGAGNRKNTNNNNNSNNRNNANNNNRNNSNNNNRNSNNRNNNNRNNNNRNNNAKNNNVNPAAEKPVEKEEVIKTIILPEKLTIKTLAEKMKQQPAALVKKLFLQGTMVTVNQEIDFDAAEEIALEYNFIAELEEKIDVIEELLKEEEDDASTLVSRPPVVCVMGHVDHGKTSLLDAIRQTKVIEKEAGGITQHIGAYVVNVDGQKITFLDTPGHEAFTSMRMRGANSTDIAILVVAADDGVMPQTIEAINHAKAAGIEIIVAINKIDKPSANIDRVKQELAEHELVAEDWGGSTTFVPVSAHTKEGIDELLEMILLTADILELKANPKRNARGLVIEAKLDKGKGSVATILVQKGTLNVGDSIAVGSCHGKVRAMMDDKGRRVKEAGPSTPVEILGLNDVPNAGEIFVATNNEKEARSFAETYISQNRERLLEDTKAKMSLDDLFTQIQAGNLKELGIIVKADVQGSVEAIKQSLLKLSNEEVVVKIIHGGVGAINESDVILASASNAIIIGFNVRPDATAKSIAEREKVDLRLYRVIYDAIEDVESAMKGMLDPVFEEKVLGHAEVRQTFKASGIGTIAGSYVLDGLFQRGCSTRVTRDGELLFEGALASLKRFKDDVKEVKAGYECGLVFEKFNDLKEGDIVEAYTMVEVPR